MPTTRREFLHRVLGSSTLVSLGISVPEFITRSAHAARDAAKGDAGSAERVLVVVQLSGGNDGLNTVVPYGDDAYARNRIVLRIAANQVLKIDDYLGLHPQMQGMTELLQHGRLAIVQGVGYPNPDRSHFRSMDIWHSARVEGDPRDGWLGRYLDQVFSPRDRDGGSTSKGDPRPFATAGTLPAIHVGEDRLPLALQGRGIPVPSVRSLEQFQLNLRGSPAEQRQVREVLQRLAELPRRGVGSSSVADDIPSQRAGSDALLQFLRRSALATYTSSEKVREALERRSSGVQYPGFGLAQRLKMVAQMIDASLGARIYYVELAGFDTHANQSEAHAALLHELSESVAAFMQDMDQRCQAERVLLLTFSEFGRRVRENASRGTDHGAAAPMFLVGGRVQAGLVGPHPSLTDLDAGDLKFHTDFRQVYATILDRWLGCSSELVLGQRFDHVENLLPI